jgi:hypothetical protein
MSVSDGSDTARLVAECAFASASASSAAAHCRRWGRRSASSTPAVGLEHAKIIRELLAVEGKKRRRCFFYRTPSLIHSLELSGAIRRVPKHCHVDGGDIETKNDERPKQRR